MESRLKLIENLNSFMKDKIKTIDNVISSLNWNKEFIINKETVQCPYDINHWVPQSTFAKHLEKCSWLKDGYDEKEFNEQPPDSEFFYQNTSVTSLTIDNRKQAEILLNNDLLYPNEQNSQLLDTPKTYERMCVNLNADQRCAIYDYIVKESKEVKQTNKVSLEELMIDFEKRNNNGDKPKTLLQILAEQRDYKRRRQSYRAKNVHNTKKTYTEIMKEVIENQMSYLVETTKQESMENASENHPENSSSTSESKEPKHRHKKKKSKHKHSQERRSRSRSLSPKKKKHKHHRSRSRSNSRRKHKKSHKHKSHK